jgi:poly(glycerol-phosphate) alpha-glucosyltransferase
MLDPWAIKNSFCKKKMAALFYEKQCLKANKCIHALCESEYQSIRNYGLQNPICIVPNGVDMPNGAFNQRLECLINKIVGGRKILLYLSRLHPKKGLVNLIHAWRKIKNEGLLANDWVLGIAGWDQGGHEKELMILADTLGIKWFKKSDWVSDGMENKSTSIGNGNNIEADVIFFGPAFGDKKDALFRYCSGFILPSYSEGMPVAVLEAWSYGKPVIMTKECNLDVGFVEGAAIRVEPTADSVALGIRNLVEMGDAEIMNMGNKGRRLVEKQFTWPEIAKQMKSVYDWMVGGGSPPSCVVVD